MYNFDFLRGVFFLALIGFIATAVALMVGLPALIWFVAHHIAFV